MPQKKNGIKSLWSALVDLCTRPLETLQEFLRKGDVMLLALCVMGFSGLKLPIG